MCLSVFCSSSSSSCKTVMFSPLSTTRVSTLLLGSGESTRSRCHGYRWSNRYRWSDRWLNCGPQALAKDVSKKQHIADAWAGAARMLVSALRPLSGLALVQVLLAFKVKVLGFGKLGLLLLKKGMFFCKAKAALSLEASIKNPARLFRRQAGEPNGETSCMTRKRTSSTIIQLWAFRFICAESSHKEDVLHTSSLFVSFKPKRCFSSDTRSLALWTTSDIPWESWRVCGGRRVQEVCVAFPPKPWRPMQ